MLLHDLLDRAVRRYPAGAAVRDDTDRLTYAELDATARRFAAWLWRQGVRGGDRVVVRHPNAVATVVLLYAVSRLNAVLVPLSPAMSRFQLRQVLADADPAIVLTGAGEVAGIASGTGRRVVDLAEAWAESEKERGAGTGESPGGPDDLALIMYTSGSTAAPKGVMCPHRQVTFAVDAINRRLGYGSDDRVLCRSPFSFDYGLYQLLLAAHGGSEAVLAPDGEARLLAAIHRHGVTVVPVVPSLAGILIRLAGRDPRPTAVRLFTNTGATLDGATSAGLRRAFPGARISVMFGITECKRVSVMEPDGDLARPGSVGRPLDGTRVLVLDDGGRSLPPGRTGELVVVGPHVMAGYWRAPDLTRTRFRPLPETGEAALWTGDYGHLDDAGFLYFAGRRDEIFKRRGIRTSTTEIEAAAMDVPGVHAAAVPAPAGDGALVLYVVSDGDAATVLSGLRERLESAKVPDRCRRLPRLPCNANGKVAKALLAEHADHYERHPASAKGTRE